jgi:hypothetical protein
MKKLLACCAVALIFLVGCAATNYKLARGHANDVKNGMTVSEVISIIGIPPTDQDVTHIEWRRGNAQTYDGTKNGSIRYELRAGKVVDVPDGGIYSDSAAATAKRIRVEREAIRNAEWLAAVNATQEAAEAAAAKKAADEAARAASAAAKYEADQQKLAEQLNKELIAERSSSYSCADKITCTKAFALAQIFVSSNSDQKIQVATDTIVETYNPTEEGKIGMKVVKTPGKGTSEVISIAPSCKEDKYSALLCSMRRTQAYEGLRTFIERSLSR